MEAYRLELIDYEGAVEEVRVNPIAHYFQNVKNLELTEAYLRFFSPEAVAAYGTAVQEEYDILYDRIMTADISVFLKQEVEQWYGFNKDMVGFVATVELNRELEEMLRRFELL